MKKEDIEKHKEKNTKIAKSRIKIGIILNQIAEKNNLKINDEEIKKEIQNYYIKTYLKYIMLQELL